MQQGDPHNDHQKAESMSLSFDPQDIVVPKGHFIAGKLLPGRDGTPVIRPSDGEAFADCPIAGEGLVDQAVAAAKAAFADSGWATQPPRARLEALHRWADLIEREATYLARLESVCSTRPITQVVGGDIPVTAEQIRFFAEFADKEGSDVVPTEEMSFGMTLSEPYGVVGAITPWNFPISMAGWKLGPALAAGNAVVIKPSEMTPFSTVYLAQLAVEAGIPAGILNVVLGDGQTTGRAITRHPEIGKVSFTGSTAAGRAIMQDIGDSGVKPMTLELGGKSPQIVFADADLDLAARAVAQSMLANAGQACVAGTRVIVEKSAADRFTELLVANVASVRPGVTWHEDTGYSPIISERQISRIERIVGETLNAGGVNLLGGRRFDNDGYFYQPTLLSVNDSSSPAITEEIFGPVVTLQTFSGEDEALVLAAHSTYGLAAGLFTRDLSRAIRLTRRIQVGTVWVNRYGRSRDHILPTGGYKQSGIGKDLGRDAYLANRKTKSVLIGL